MINLKKERKDHITIEKMKKQVRKYLKLTIINKKETNMIGIIKEAMIIKEKEVTEMITDKEIEIEKEIEKEMNQKRNISRGKKTIEMIDFQNEKKEVTRLKDLIMMINLTFQIKGIIRIIQMIRIKVRAKIFQVKINIKKRKIIQRVKNDLTCF